MTPERYRPGVPFFAVVVQPAGPRTRNAKIPGAAPGDGSKLLMHRLLDPLSFVAFKMDRLRGGPSRTGTAGVGFEPSMAGDERH